MTPGTAAEEAPSRRGPALAGAALGAAAGVGAWALATSLVGSWTGFLALGVGALAGLGSKRLGGKGTPAAAAAAAVAMAAIFAGFGFASRAAIERNREGRIAAVDRAAYDRFDAAAKDWDPRLRGDDVSKFAYRHEFVTYAQLSGVGAQVAEFRRTTVPQLEAWKKRPPAFEAWRSERRAAIRAEGSPWAAYLSSPMTYVSPLDLLCWLLGGAAAAWTGNVRQAARIMRRREGA
jgi:hypothetical protein